MSCTGSCTYTWVDNPMGGSGSWVETQNTCSGDIGAFCLCGAPPTIIGTPSQTAGGGCSDNYHSCTYMAADEITNESELRTVVVRDGDCSPCDACSEDEQCCNSLCTNYYILLNDFIIDLNQFYNI